MPRNGSGDYSVPQNSWNPVINNAQALPNDWMAILNDMAAALQASIAADGQTPITGSLNFGGNRARSLGAPQGSGDGLRFEQMAKGQDVPSAATIAFPIEGGLFDVTGTTTITAIAETFPGRTVVAHFTGALTLVNSANLILPGGANIATHAGDFSIFVCLDGTKWQRVVGTAASSDLTTSPTDATPGRVLKVGDWGIGGAPVVPWMTFAQIDALTADQGPIMCLDMQGSPFYTWVNTPYFTGYRSGRCGEMPDLFVDTPRPWELLMTGGVWNINDPKQKRVIALLREQGKVCLAANWIKGQGMIADLGSGNWKAPDEQDMFMRKSGSDPDTANAAPVGTYKADALQNIVGTTGRSLSTGADPTSGALFGDQSGALASGGTGSIPLYWVNLDASRVARTSTETRGKSTRTAPVILI